MTCTKLEAARLVALAVGLVALGFVLGQRLELQKRIDATRALASRQAFLAGQVDMLSRVCRGISSARW